MVNEIKRSDIFVAPERDFHRNKYYEFVFEGNPYAHTHLQINDVDGWAYIHFTFVKFTKSLVKPLKIDWRCLKNVALILGVNKLVGMKDSEVRTFKKFLKMLGENNIEEILIYKMPFLMVVVEL